MATATVTETKTLTKIGDRLHLWVDVESLGRGIGAKLKSACLLLVDADAPCASLEHVADMCIVNLDHPVSAASPRCGRGFWDKLPAETLAGLEENALSEADACAQIEAFLQRVETNLGNRRIDLAGDFLSFDVGKINVLLEKYVPQRVGGLWSIGDQMRFEINFDSQFMALPKAWQEKVPSPKMPHVPLQDCMALWQWSIDIRQAFRDMERDLQNVAATHNTASTK